MVLAADLVSRHDAGTLTQLAGALAEGGFVLLEEAHRALDDAGAADVLARAGLLLAARQVAASCEYVLLRKVPQLPPTNVIIDVSAPR